MILGIDLGTTKSVAATWRNGRLVVLADEAGRRHIPSLVLVTRDGEIVAGNAAAKHPERYTGRSVTVSSVKRLMGKSGETGWGWWKAYPQEVSAFILAELKFMAEQSLHEQVTGAVVAIPSHFDEGQRRATKEAAEIAGLPFIRLLNEATAAAIAYGQRTKQSSRILVVDFGGGTLDVSMVECGEGVFEEKCIEGDSRLGGDDMDQTIMDFWLEQMERRHGKDAVSSLDQLRTAVLRETAERAKVALSDSKHFQTHLPGFVPSAGGHADVDLALDRATFESLTKGMVERAVGVIVKALVAAKAKASDLDTLLLIGGASRVPSLREAVTRKLGVKPFSDVDIETCVAEGAATWAAVLAGERRDIVLSDVVPSTYGLQLMGDEFVPIIVRNTAIPTRKSHLFTTSEDGQTVIAVPVLQGESSKASDNTYLATLEMRGIPPAERGVPQVEVTFDVDGEATVHVSARDKATGNESVVVTLRSPYGLEPRQIRVMQKRLSAMMVSRAFGGVASGLRDSIREVLTRGAKGLSGGVTREIESSLEALGNQSLSCRTHAEAEAAITAARRVLEKAQDELTTHAAVLDEVDGLSRRIEALLPLVGGSPDGRKHILSQGRELLVDLLARDTAAGAVRNTVDGVRRAYIEAACELVESAVKKLRLYPALQAWRESLGAAVLDGASVAHYAQQIKEIAGSEAVLQLMRTERRDYLMSIERAVLSRVAGERSVWVTFLLVCAAILDPRVIAFADSASPANELDEPLIAAHLFGLAAGRDAPERLYVAESLLRLPLSARHGLALLRCIGNEVDVQVKATLLRSLARLPSGSLARLVESGRREVLDVICQSRDAALALLQESDADSSVGVIERLSAFPFDEVRQEYFLRVGSSHPGVRRAAIRAILTSSVPDSLADSVCAQALQDSLTDVRLCALEYAGQRPAAFSAQVADMLEREVDEAVLGSAIAILGNSADLSCVPRLLRSLRTVNPRLHDVLRASIAKNLARLDDSTRLFFTRLATENRAPSFVDKTRLRWMYSRRVELQPVIQALLELRA